MSQSVGSARTPWSSPNGVRPPAVPGKSSALADRRKSLIRVHRRLDELRAHEAFEDDWQDLTTAMEAVEACIERLKRKATEGVAWRNANLSAKKRYTE